MIGMVRVALIVVLLAALAGLSRTFAQDDPKERARNDHGEREKKWQAHKRDWPMIGHDPTNTRNQPFERQIWPVNVHRLALSGWRPRQGTFRRRRRS